jgi:uncharacterized repeat protein (TIGR03803 family)
LNHTERKKVHAKERVRSLILEMNIGAVATALPPQPTAAGKYRSTVTTLTIVFALAVVLMQSAQAQTYTVLHNFTGGADGASPLAGLTIDGAGNLYGTTYYGGSVNNGVVFKLAHKGAGFVFNILHSFGSEDALNPSAKVTIGRDGNLYGTTPFGVPGTGCGEYGCGTVFNLRLPPTACHTALCPWNESIAYQFPAGEKNGAWPFSAVIFDQNGNMFGTTQGNNLPGNAFELMPSGSGWIQSVIFTFADQSTGTVPMGDLVRDQAGNLYGVTWEGGVNKVGLVFQLAPSGSGWTENVLRSFDLSSDGANPAGGLILDKAGNLYGTTGGNGGWGVGTVFMLSPSGGTWNETILHNFARNENPEANLTMDAAGNLYGTTLRGGKDGGGTIFKMTPGSGGWTYTVLKEFDTCNDGCFPMSDVTIGASGNLYGTTSGGGTYGQGVVWEITP